MYNACPCFLKQKCSTKVKLWLTKTTSVKLSCYFFLLLYKKSIKRWLMACSSMEVQWEKIIVNRKISSRLSVDSNYVKELSRHRKKSSLSTPNDFPTMLSGGGSWDPTGGEQTMGPQDCGGRRCCHSYEGIARITSLFYIFWREKLREIIQVEKVLGIDTPAHKAGLKAGDVLVEVQGELITMMTHPQVSLRMNWWQKNVLMIIFRSEWSVVDADYTVCSLYILSMWDDHLFDDKKVVNLIRGVRGNTLRLKVERGDHVVPNIQVKFRQYSQ